MISLSMVTLTVLENHSLDQILWRVSEERGLLGAAHRLRGANQPFLKSLRVKRNASQNDAAVPRVTRGMTGGTIIESSFMRIGKRVSHVITGEQ